MSDLKDFVIENGVLTNYIGNDKTVKIPNSVKHIDCLAFFNDNKGNDFVTNIVLPNGVESIGYNAFQCCKNLTDITIPNSVKTFGDNIVVKCDRLKTIIASDDVLKKLWEQLGTKQKNNIILQSAKSGDERPFICKKIKDNKKKLMEIAIAEDDAALTNNIFALFEKISLDELVGYIKKSVSAHQVTAFLLDYKNNYYSTDKQESYETDKTEKELGLKERTPADWKKIFSYKKTDKGIIITGYKGEDVDVVVPATIGSDAVIEIAEGAFSPGVEKLNVDLKDKRSAIRSVVVSLGIKKINKCAFYGCRNLKSIDIADSVTSVGERAFEYCFSLTDVVLSQKIKSINPVIFGSCRELKKLTLPKAVTSVGIAAFADCKKLETIYIPGTLTKIGDRGKYDANHAFIDCPALTIHAPAGSYAEQYAKENNIPFVAE